MNFSKQLLPDWIGLFDHFPVWVETIIGQIVYVNDSYRDRYGDETPAVIGSRRANPLQFFGARHDDHRRLRSGDNIRVTVVSFAQEIHGNHFFCHIDLPVQDADAAGSGDLEQFPLAALSFDSRHLRLNQRWLDLFGYPAGFFQNHPQWISSLFGQAADEIVQQSPQRNDDSASWVGTITTAAGEYRTLEVWRKVVNGRTTLFATNITAQAELLERLIDENERTRLALAGTQIGIWDWLTGQDIVWLSPELNGLLGYPAIWSQSDFNGFLNLFAIEEQQQIVDYLETHLRLQTPFDLSCRLRLRSGEARWVQLRGQCQRDAAGNAVRMAGSIADISEHRQAMAALATSESQLNTAQQVAHLGNWEWRMADDSMGWSAAMFALHNVPTGNAAPAMESFIRLIYPADQPHVRTLLQQVVSGREAGSTEYRVSSRDGRLQDIWLTCYPHFSGHGELLSLYGTAQDISERKRIEREQLKNRDSDPNDEEQWTQVLTSDVRRPVKEETESHVILRNVPDELGFRFQKLVRETVTDAGGRTRPAYPGLRVIDAKRREYPLDTVDVPMQTALLPSPLRSKRDLEVRVEGVATHIIGWMREKAYKEDVDRRPMTRSDGSIDLGIARTGTVSCKFGPNEWAAKPKFDDDKTYTVIGLCEGSFTPALSWCRVVGESGGVKAVSLNDLLANPAKYADQKVELSGVIKTATPIRPAAHGAPCTNSPVGVMRVEYGAHRS